MKSIRFDNELNQKIKMKITNNISVINDKKVKGISLCITKNDTENTSIYTLKEAEELYKLLGAYFSPEQKLEDMNIKK